MYLKEYFQFSIVVLLGLGNKTICLGSHSKTAFVTFRQHHYMFRIRKKSWFGFKLVIVTFGFTVKHEQH